MKKYSRDRKRVSGQCCTSSSFERRGNVPLYRLTNRQHETKRRRFRLCEVRTETTNSLPSSYFSGSEFIGGLIELVGPQKHQNVPNISLVFNCATISSTLFSSFLPYNSSSWRLYVGGRVSLIRPIPLIAGIGPTRLKFVLPKVHHELKEISIHRVAGHWVQRIWNNRCSVWEFLNPFH